MKRCFFLKAALAAVLSVAAILPTAAQSAQPATNTAVRPVNPYASITYKERQAIAKWQDKIRNMTGFTEQENELLQFKAYMAERNYSEEYLWAGKQLIDLREGRNWKVGESERERLVEELKSLGYWLELAMLDYHNQVAADSLIANHKEQLLGKRTSAWSSRAMPLPEDYFITLPTSIIANDYEYLIWYEILSFSLPKEKKEQYIHLLQDAFRERITDDSLNQKRMCELAAFVAISDSAEFEAFKLRNQETGLAPLAENNLISIEKQRIDSEKKWSEAAALALNERCKAFEADRKKLSKRPDLAYWELMIVQTYRPRQVAESLNKKEVVTSVEDSVLLVMFKNVPKATLAIKGSQHGAKYKETIVNPATRYYLTDTVKMAIPNLPDDTYTITTRGGGKKDEKTCSIASLAIAWRFDSGLREFYVTDAKTGRPVDSVALWVWRNDTTQKVKKPVIADLRLDGFTPLPAELEKAAADSQHSYNFRLTTKDADGLHRRTDVVRLQRANEPWKPQASDHGALYLDRSVVQGGDSVRFKGIAWHRTALGEQTVVPAGRTLQVILSGPRGAKGDTLTLTANEFGAVAGGFLLPKEALGGTWRLQLLDGKKYLASTGFLVGDIVLPTFDASFDPIDRLILPGEEFPVEGTVTMLSGHPASGAKIIWTASKESGETTCEADGRFRIVLHPEQSWLSLQMDATSAEGETRSFNKSYNLSPSLQVNIEGLRGGQSSANYAIISGTTLQARLSISSPDGSATATPVTYRLKAGRKTLASGEIPADELLQISLPEDAGRRFTLEAEINVTSTQGKKYNSSVTREIYRMEDTDTSLIAPVDWYLERRPCETGVKARFGGAKGDIWAIAELWGTDAAGAIVRFGSQRIHIHGNPGAEGSLQEILFPRDENWSENLTLTILWFKERMLHTQRLEYTVEKEEIPLEFTRFTDAIHPGAEATFTLRTRLGTEGVATVFDKAMNALRSNYWPALGASGRTNVSVPYTQYDRGDIWNYHLSAPHDGDKMDDVLVVGYGSVKTRGATRTGLTRTNSVMFKSAAMVESVAEESIALATADVAPQFTTDDTGAGVIAPETFRSDLSSVLAFEPFLRPDTEGNISFTIKASDRLSQFVVRTLVHDRQAHSAVVERLMTVTLPVKVGLLPPAVLYEGDRVEFAVTAANASETPVTGKLSLQLFDGAYRPGARPLLTQTDVRTLRAGETTKAWLDEVSIPACTSDTLGILVAFTSDGATDALSQAVPVRPRAQIIKETHSMLLRGGEDLAAARAALLKEFQNADPSQVTFEERTIAEMLDQLEQRLCRFEREDAISLANALLVKTLLGQPTDSLTQELAACQNADGGYGWMKGMDSSPYVTAMLLDRFARIDKRDGDTRRAIQWLDSVCLGEKRVPWWRGGVSMPIYLYIRSLFPELPIVGKTSYAQNEVARDWLNPNKMDRKYDCLYDRALRARTLLNMTASDQGVDLAKFFGFTFFAERKLRKSLEKEAEYLLDYAVEHPSGGWYYPNLVMPWRGLMEGEAYAHTFMCDILRDIAARSAGEGGTPKPSTTGGTQTIGTRPTAAEIADGIRLWLLVQRETQAWTEDPAYAMAIASIREGSPELLDTRVLIARSESSLPLEKIKVSGNQMKIERQWQVKRGGKWTAVKDGTRLCVGDRVRSVLNLWSQENRSFVIVTAPRPGNLQPVNQVSGYAGARGGYRNVRSDRTEFLFDAYPEEKLSLTEEYRVTHGGTFIAAPAEIVCTYADHYRANDRYRPALWSYSWQ
ncbi:MAG: hypothetical protein IJS91_04620 [Bacteroidales bacterium]|nr:hypothetical protein [Bacteroidales bacterium]